MTVGVRLVAQFVVQIVPWPPLTIMFRACGISLPPPYFDLIKGRQRVSGVHELSSLIRDPESRAQCAALERNVKEFGLTYFGLQDKRQG
jgi:hypothetical protein